MSVFQTASAKMFPVLEHAIFDKGIKKKTIADRLNISFRALANKLTGVSEFTWEEVCIIQEHFFPEIPKERLMQKQS